ncbi:hypothetical protein KCP78_19035 [Salmonella enterica subsp. enterica]|nr:hypothetical protein KCP78_19035 [Salmonella enterica subsp. enterica]
MARISRKDARLTETRNTDIFTGNGTKSRQFSHYQSRITSADIEIYLAFVQTLLLASGTQLPERHVT